MLEVFDKTFILTTEKRYPRFKNNLENKLKKLGVTNLKVFEVGKDWIDEEIPEGWTGRKQSWNYWNCIWAIIKIAKKENLEDFLFVEDDADFQPNFEEVFPKACLEISPKWEMFYLGGNHHSSLTFRVTEHLLRCSCTLDMHCVAISNRVYDKILSFADAPWLKTNPYADVAIANQIHPNGNTYACCPSLVWQHDGWSDNEQRYMSRKENWQHNGHMIDLRGV